MSQYEGRRGEEGSAKASNIFPLIHPVPVNESHVQLFFHFVCELLVLSRQMPNKRESLMWNQEMNCSSFHFLFSGDNNPLMVVCVCACLSVCVCVFSGG